jgi:hypothetical protein
MPVEVLETLRNRCWQLRNQIRQADNLSVPVPPGRWRWADVKNGYGRKSEQELAADRERNRQLAITLRQKLTQVEAYLEEQLAS